MNLLSGTKFRRGSRTYISTGIWMLGTKKMDYEFIEEGFPENIQKRKCETIDEMIKNGEIQILGKK